MYPPKPSLAILYPGNCEPLKAAFHGVALALAGVMGAYNAAAWLRRRQSHLAINAVIYLAAAVWEHRHVSHHLVPCLPAIPAPGAEIDTPVTEEPTRVRAA